MELVYKNYFDKFDIYLNENFINVNVAPYAANTLSNSTVNELCVIYQTATNLVCWH